MSIISSGGPSFDQSSSSGSPPERLPKKKVHHARKEKAPLLKRNSTEKVDSLTSQESLRQLGTSSSELGGFSTNRLKALSLPKAEDLHLPIFHETHPAGSQTSRDASRESMVPSGSLTARSLRKARKPSTNRQERIPRQKSKSSKRRRRKHKQSSVSSSSQTPLFEIGGTLEVGGERRERISSILRNLLKQEKQHLKKIDQWLDSELLLHFAEGSEQPNEVEIFTDLHTALGRYRQQVFQIVVGLFSANKKTEKNLNKALKLAAESYQHLDTYLKNSYECVAKIERVVKLLNILGEQGRVPPGLHVDSLIDLASKERILSENYHLNLLLLLEGENPTEESVNTISNAAERAKAFLEYSKYEMSPAAGVARDDLLRGVPTEKLRNYGAALGLLAAVPSGNLEVQQHFIQGGGGVFGRQGLQGLNPYEFLAKVFEVGNREERRAILETLYEHLRLGWSLPTQSEDIEKFKQALQSILNNVSEGEAPRAMEVMDLVASTFPQKEGRLSSTPSMASSSSSSSSSSSAAPSASRYEELPEELINEYMKRLEKIAKSSDIKDIKSKDIYQELSLYLGETLKEINLSELDRIGHLTPTLSAHAERTNLVVNTLALLILLSKNRQKAYEKVFGAFRLAKESNHFDLANALSAALQLRPVERLSIHSDVQVAELQHVAAQSGRQQAGMQLMKGIMERGSSFVPNIATILSAVTQTMERAMTNEEGVVDYEGMSSRMQLLGDIKLLVQKGLDNLKKMPIHVGKKQPQLVAIAGEVFRLQQDLGRHGNNGEIFEGLLRKFSNRYKPYPAGLL